MAGGSTDDDRLNRITVCQSRRGQKRRRAQSACKILLSDLCGTQRSLRCTGHPPAALASLGRHACSVSPLTAITARSGINRAVDRVARRFAPHRPGAAEAGTTFVGARPHEQRWRREKLGRCRRQGPDIARRPRCATYSTTRWIARALYRTAVSCNERSSRDSFL